MRIECLVTLGALALAAAITESALGQQTTIFHDDFESANFNNWTVASGTNMTIDSTKNIDPAGFGRYSAHSTASEVRLYHNLAGDNGGAEVDGASTLTAWIYDSSMTRTYVQALGYSGAGYNSGSLDQLLGIGKYTSVSLPGDVYDPTKYQGRVLYGVNEGWFNLNLPGTPSRSPGWHEFTISREADDTTIDFYVDGILGRKITGSRTEAWDSITMGFGFSSSSNGDTWYDGISVTVAPVPEPSLMSLGILGWFVLAAAGVSRRKKPTATAETASAACA